MEVNLSYIEFLLKLLNNEENLSLKDYQEELSINTYITLLSLSNFEYTENYLETEQEKLNNFLRKLNNLKVKIQLNGKKDKIIEFKDNLITQYYENVNILSIYIKDNLEFETILNSLDAKSITKLIDEITKNKILKETNKDIIKEKRNKIINLLPKNNYYISNETIYIENDNIKEEITITEFKELFNYLLNIDIYKKIYKTKANQISHELIINHLIKTSVSNELPKNNVEKIVIPLVFTRILSLNIDDMKKINNSEFNIENIKISELYSLASSNHAEENTVKWRNISIPNEYLVEKVKEIIAKGMYYYKDNDFILDNPGEFKLSIDIDKMNNILKTILETKINNKHSKKNK